MSKLNIGDIVTIKSLDKTQHEYGVTHEMMNLMQNSLALRVVNISSEGVMAELLSEAWAYHPSDLEVSS